MHVAKINVQGNSLAGLYIVPLTDVVLVGPDVSELLDKDLAEIFGARVERMTIAGTSLLGVFLATDGEKLLVPHIILPHEEALLQRLAIPYMIVPSDLTCIGNNVVLTPKGALVNPEYDKEAADAIASFLERPVQQVLLANLPTVGSVLVATATKGLISHEASDAEIAQAESFLGIAITSGTVNMGSTQIRSGVAANNSGFVIGEASGGPELMNADYAFGFIE